MTINSIAEQLATATLTSEQIKNSLRVLGYRAAVPRLRTALATSSALAPQFSILEKIFPNAKRILGNFQLSKAILNQLDLSPDCILDLPNKLPLRSATPFCSSIIGDQYKQIDFNRHQIIGEVISFFWLTYASLHAHSGIEVSKNLGRLLQASLDFVQFIHHVVKDEPSLGETTYTGFHNGDIGAWIESASILIESIRYLGLLPASLENIKSGLVEACALIQSIEENRPQSPHKEKLNKFIANRYAPRGVTLGERERFSSYHNAFLDAELEGLTDSIRMILEKNYNDTFSRTSAIGATPPFYVEATITALALATGRSIEDAIKFPMNPKSDEYIELVLFPGYNSKYYYPIWKRTITGINHPLRIAIPELLLIPFRDVFRFSEATLFEDCLPYSLTPWSDRCYNWISRKFPSPKSQIRRKIRDTLARALYASSASSSLLNLIATAPTTGWHARESLSHYVNPFDKRTTNAYASACSKIFGKYGASTDVRLIASSLVLRTAEHQVISQYFIAEIESAKKAGNHIDYHNCFARYCLMLLIVATGHRKSKTPFFFHWDVLTDENLAFICDKAVVGSEARFVPLPNWVSKQIREYHKHLLSFSNYLAYESPELARKIHHLAVGGDMRLFDEAMLQRDSSTIESHSFGMFFIIDSDHRVTTISTSDLAGSYKSVSNINIPAFRKSVADALWSSGLSGQQVEAFLGHNAEMHLFGESSSWSFIGWADQVRPKIEEYLSLRGWKEVTAWVRKFQINNKSEFFGTPYIESSNDSYEGRARSSSQALALAQKIIRSNLPDDWFSDDNTSINDEDVRKLKEIVLENLKHDQKAAVKVNQALASEIDRLRIRLRTVSSTVTNLTRTEPSPIEISSSRCVALAKVIRSRWIGKLGKYKREAQEKIPDRLVEIGISLVIFDAVLDKDNWRALLFSIANHETRSAHGCLIVHARVEKPSMVFDKSLILSPHTAALVIGYKKNYSDFKPDDSFVETATRLIPKLLQEAYRDFGSDVLTLKNLFVIYRPWWQIRLPGAQFAIACGHYCGPSADIQSECAIYEINFFNISTKLDSTSHANTKAGISTTKSALNEVNKMLKQTEGVFEKMESTSKSQRKKLRCLLIDQIPQKLQSIADQQPIVDLLLGFILYLTEEGGPRKEILKFGAIRTYFSNIRLLMEILWDKNLQDFESEDFDSYYKQLLEKTKVKATNTKTPLTLFHKFLRESISAPSCRFAPNSDRIPTQCRAALITISQFNEAWKLVDQLTLNNVQLNQHAKSYLSIGYGYGLRRKEIFGLEAEHLCRSGNKEKIKNNEIKGIRVKPNVVRDLKSSSSNRFFPSVLSEKKQYTHLLKIVAQSTESRAKRAFIFADPEQRNALFSTRTIDVVVRDALRNATGNYDVVPYSMRHTSATRLAHFAFEPPRQIPLSQHVEQSIKSSLESEQFFKNFDGGFHSWPFWIDRVAMLLGHSDVSTLLNTYWHTSSLRLAENTWHATANVHLTDDQIALMLGRERSSIVHMKSNFLKKIKPDAEPPNIYELLISHYSTISKFPELGSANSRATKIGKAKAKEANSTIDGEDMPIIWVAYDRLLCRRLADGLSLAELENYARSLGISKSMSSNFIEAYRHIVKKTGFDDFEPPNSEILASDPTRSRGILRGAIEREIGLTAAHRLAQSQESFSDILRTVLSLWVERINPGDPWFVAEDEVEVLSVINTLNDIGVENSQLEFCQCNFDTSRLRRMLTKLQVSSMETRPTRISSGPKGIRVSEVGIRVMQMHKSKIGDNRDTHRLALVLATIVRAENLSETRNSGRASLRIMQHP